MRLTTHLTLETNAAIPAPCILMLHPRTDGEQSVELTELKTSIPCRFREYTDVYGNSCLRTTIPVGLFRLENRIIANCADTLEIDEKASILTMDELPDQVLQFVLPSRYCEADLLTDTAREIIGTAQTGYQQVENIRRWVHEQFEYAYGTSGSSTSARDALATRKGVCRDFAHVCIALCRSLDIPARMVVGYLHELNPMDLHAWFQAYLGGRWFTFDATQPIPKGNRIIIAYGKDAADVAIATYFMPIELTKLTVQVSVTP